MIGVFNTIQIDSDTILAPNDFTPAREDVYAAEITTCTGKLIADRIGWKYADMNLKWDMLPQSQLAVLLALGGTFSLKFTDVNGTTVTEDVISKGIQSTGTRVTDADGNVIWRDVELGVTFIDVH